MVYQKAAKVKERANQVKRARAKERAALEVVPVVAKKGHTSGVSIPPATLSISRLRDALMAIVAGLGTI